jgi:prepilin-type N-terminal cleavage/methylation domain-containing protein
MRKNKGFTLIELMIVVAIIAIIAAIAIPNLLASRKAANQTNAIGALKAIHSAEVTWRPANMSGTGKADYWTRDVSHLYRMLKGGSVCKYVSLPVAKADISWDADDSIAANISDDWQAISTTLGPNAGYYVQALVDSDSAGTDYNVNAYTGTAVLVANDFLFGFMAAPAVYGQSGDQSYIINQEGAVYAADTGAQASVWFTTGVTSLRWNANDPTNTTAWPIVTGGKAWSATSN